MLGTPGVEDELRKVIYALASDKKEFASGTKREEMGAKQDIKGVKDVNIIDRKVHV